MAVEITAEIPDNPHIILVRLVGVDYGDENGTLACITADGAVAVFPSKVHAAAFMAQSTKFLVLPHQFVKVEI